MHNVGSVDQVIRIILGLILLAVAVSPFAGAKWLQLGTLLAAAWLIITGFVGICPIYSLIGVNTCQECLAEEELEYKLESERHLKPSDEEMHALSAEPVKKKAKGAAKRTAKRAAKKATTKRKAAKKTTKKSSSRKKAGKKATRKTTKAKKSSAKKRTRK